jgi:8-oxo-dGTP pyrophosphatase MutT (NUDIX family)
MCDIYEDFSKKYFSNKPVVCLNCSGLNHVYKNCNMPRISTGIICYQMKYDELSNSIQPIYLMVQRKDSLSYVEFIRGKYDIQNKTYIYKLFTLMTSEERDFIKNTDFETLWKQMWCKTEDDNNKNFTKEYNEAIEKFMMLKKGYYLICNDEKKFINIYIVLDETISLYNETEYGFPKGRRNINEDDLSCAIREFKEETGIHPKFIRLSHDIKPLEETFTGSNKTRYKHIYYIAKYYPFSIEDHNITKKNCREIKKIIWCTYNEVQDHIRDYNVERKELIKRCNNIILRNINI